MKKKTKKYLKRMIRADFDSAHPNDYWKMTDCIEASKDAGFKKLAREMLNDLKQ